jgi:hypothetical protein
MGPGSEGRTHLLPQAVLTTHKEPSGGLLFEAHKNP